MNRRGRAGYVGLGVGCVLVLLALWAHAETVRTDTHDFVGGMRLGTGVRGQSSSVITGSSTAGNAAVVLPGGAVGAAEMSGVTVVVMYCGENAENGTIYFGPVPLTTVEPALADTTCDALDNATEATVDAVVSAGLTLYPRYMRCISDGTMGAGETQVYQLRDDAASVTSVTCTIAEGLTECEVLTPTAGAVAAGSATAMSLVETSNNADGDESKCKVWYAVQP